MTSVKELTSTQQSTNYVDYAYGRNIGFTARRFLKEFRDHISMNIGESVEKERFLYLESPDKKLSMLLDFYTNSDSYKLVKSIGEIIYYLLLHGKTYVETILFFDSEKNLSKITFKPIHYKTQLKFFNKLHYRVKDYSGKNIYGCIESKNLITFKLTDLGYPKAYFKRKIRKLDKINKLSLSKLSYELSSVELEVYKNKENFKNLKIMKDVYWTEDPYNHLISEPYLLFRKMKFVLLQKVFLDYVLNKCNKKLVKLGEKYNFSGEIKYKTRINEYDILMKDLQSGTKNCGQISDEILGLG